nr:hypothetical protein Iba_chr15eCG6120 [Ipomoea batatas]
MPKIEEQENRLFSPTATLANEKDSLEFQIEWQLNYAAFKYIFWVELFLNRQQFELTGNSREKFLVGATWLQDIVSAYGLPISIFRQFFMCVLLFNPLILLPAIFTTEDRLCEEIHTAKYIKTGSQKSKREAYENELSLL